MRLVLDTDIIVAGARSPSGASAELLRLARKGTFVPIVSVPLVLEYEAKLTAPEHLNAAGLTRNEALSIINMLVEAGVWARIHFAYRPLAKDPADEMVIETALSTDCRAIVTFNQRDFGSAPNKFGIGCWLPRDALRRVRDG